MSKDPAILFYTSDFLNGCSDLTMEERGQYITLLCLQHQKGRLTEKTIRLTVGSVSVDVMDKFLRDEDGMFYNQRMDDEMCRRAHFVETRRVNGQKGGRPTKPNGKPNAKPNGKPTDNLSENINNSIDIRNKEVYTIWKENSSNDSYKRFISFILGENSSGEELTEVLKLKNQITETKFKKLLELATETKVKISDKLIDIEKHQRTAPPNKRQKDLHLTLISWMNYGKK